jgi:hypothetical protein
MDTKNTDLENLPLSALLRIIIGEAMDRLDPGLKLLRAFRTRGAATVSERSGVSPTS